MSIDEIVHTCSNENVARAAVASIGVPFVSRVKSAADITGISMGAFVAKIVRAFGEGASARERHEIMRAMLHADQPILRGLELILERGLDEAHTFDRCGWPPVKPMLASQTDAARDGCRL